MSIEAMEIGLARTEPKNMFQLPNFSLPEDQDAPGVDEIRSRYLQRMAGWRGRFLKPLARCYFTMEKYNQAAAYLEEFTGLQKRNDVSAGFDEDAHLLLGEVYEEMGDWQAAEAVYLRIVEYFHSHPQAEEGLERAHRALHGHLGKLGPLLETCHPEAPDFQVTGADGHPLRFSELRGKVVLVFYTLTLPGDFDEIAARLDDWTGQFASLGLEVLFITARKMGDLDDGERSFRIAMDEEGMTEQYHIGDRSLLLIDRRGRLRLRQEPKSRQMRTEQELQVTDKIRELLGEGSADLRLTSEEVRR